MEESAQTVRYWICIKEQKGKSHKRSVKNAKGNNCEDIV